MRGLLHIIDNTRKDDIGLFFILLLLNITALSSFFMGIPK